MQSLGAADRADWAPQPDDELHPPLEGATSPRSCDAEAVVGPARLSGRYTAEERESSDRTVCSRIEMAVRPCRSARERRMAVREAIFAEPEERELANRARGGARMPATRTKAVRERHTLRLQARLSVARG